MSLLKSEDDIMSSLSLPASSYVISRSLSYSFNGSVYYYGQKYQYTFPKITIYIK